jgi:hypothetical protein
MTAPASGSEAAMLAAQHAPMGAKICTIRAIRTMGRKFFSRRIRKLILLQNLITVRVRSRDQVPGTMLQLQGINPAKSDAF